jgi:hypothetical protein
MENIWLKSVNELLEKIHGIKLYEYDKKKSDLMPFSLDHTLIISLDSYNCSWHSHYKKEHSEYYFIPLKISHNIVHVLDCHEYIGIHTIDISELNDILTVKQVTYKKSYYYKNELMQIVYEKIKVLIDSGTYSSIEKLAEDLTSKDILNQLESDGNLNNNNLLIRIKRLADSRKNFCRSLSFFDENNMRHFISEFKNIIYAWESIRLRLIKLMYAKNYSSSFNIKFHEDITNIISLDKNIFIQLKDMLYEKIITSNN